MTPLLTPEGYEQTRAKLAAMEKRLGELEKRTDLSALHFAEARLSYQTMIRKYRREIILYEASQSTPPSQSARS